MHNPYASRRTTAPTPTAQPNSRRSTGGCKWSTLTFPSATVDRVPYCGFALELVYPTHGIRYWTCSAEHTPPAAQVGPEIVGWAAALVSVQITEGDYTPLSQFDADAADPARFFDRLCDRIEVNRATCRDKEERDRSVADGRAPAEDDEQSSLAGGWST